MRLMLLLITNATAKSDILVIALSMVVPFSFVTLLYALWFFTRRVFAKLLSDREIATFSGI